MGVGTVEKQQSATPRGHSIAGGRVKAVFQPLLCEVAIAPARVRHGGVLYRAVQCRGLWEPLLLQGLALIDHKRRDAGGVDPHGGDTGDVLGLAWGGLAFLGMVWGADATNTTSVRQREVALIHVEDLCRGVEARVVHLFHLQPSADCPVSHAGAYQAIPCPLGLSCVRPHA